MRFEGRSEEQSTMVGTVLQDIRYGLRVLRANPGFTLTAALSLALGIGANTSMFTLVNAALFRTLPVDKPEELAYVFSGTRDVPWSTTSYPDYVDYRDHNEVFADLAAYGEIAVSISTDESPELVRGVIASGNYFGVLGVGAIRGRTFSPSDDRVPGGHAVVVISHALWMRRFGGDASAVGRNLLINGRPYVVIGVTPPLFRGSNLLEDIDLYVPMAMQALVRPPRGGFSGEMDPDLLARRASGWLAMIGRLRPGVTVDQAQAGMAAVARRLEQAYPDTNRDQITTVYPVNQIDPRAYPVLRMSALLLMGVVGLLLLIATANVANLLLARSVARRREFGIRLALGGSRMRIMRQLLTESLLLALAGAALGLLAASWSLDVLASLVPITGIFSFTLDLPIDTRVLAFTSLVAVLASLLVGFAPSLQAARASLVAALQNAAPLSAPGRLRLRGRAALVVAQVALSVVLLVLAAVFLRSFWRAQGIAPGFAVDEIATASLRIDVLRYTRARGQQFYRDVLERVSALPGVRSASIARHVPLAGNSRVATLRIRDAVSPETGVAGAGSIAGARLPTVSVSVVGPRYFETMGIGLVAGRDFSPRDAEGAPEVVIVNQTFAAKYLTEGQALGKWVGLGEGRSPWREVVGIVRDSKYRTLGEAPTPFVYQPVAQQHETGMTLLVRTNGDPRNVLGSVRRSLLALEPNLPMSDVQPLSAVVSSALFPARMAARLLSVFAGLAALLASIGLYGVMSFAVSRRTRELGIRAALGACRRDLMALVIREGVVMVGIGIAIGWALAALATRLVAGFLYVSPTDPLTFVAVAGLLGLVMLGATYVPARRATKVAPSVALRYE
jgi:putative ABC transport system permease protein